MSASPTGGDSGAGGQGPNGHGGTGSPRGDVPRGIATAIAEVSERATLLVREEIELAKAEVAEKATKLAKGAVIGVAAGIFLITALFFVLIGCAWLLYYYLPIGNQFTYFWGFFAMALILVILGLIAGLIAARAVKRGAPPTPDMAIEEARRIRDTVSAGASDAPGGAAEPGTASATAAAGASGSAPAPSYGAAASHAVDPPASSGGKGAA
ncbi:MAG TPA: phage holin family protein [Solirubrobacteraceae bacterium]|nr:phage holin family protein [Solirubrobacteraceae bacterium]